MERTFGWLRHRWKGRTRGQAMILFALVLPVLIGITGLSIDAGHLYLQRRTLQSIADAAAIAGAQNANFTTTDPGIRDPEGENDARNNARRNGVTAAEILLVAVPPTTTYVTGESWAGDDAYVEVVLERNVDTWFMNLFGQPTATIRARAVARCYLPGYGSAAILALNESDPNAITFNGGGSGVTVVGDIISYGGINPNGNPNHFDVTGSTYAYNGTSADVNSSGGDYGNDTGLVPIPAADPMQQGLDSGQYSWPTWPTSCGNWEIDAPVSTPVAKPKGGGGGGGGGGGSSGCGGNVTVQPSEDAEFDPGTYGNVTIRGDAVFNPGVYVFNRLDIDGGEATGDEVLFRIDGTGLRVDVQGNAEFNFSAIDPNTWMNIVFYAPNGDIDLGGNGDREINGSVYAPNGNVRVHGSGNDTVVNGQVIADTVTLSGDGAAVNYNPGGTEGTFGPVLVNTP